MTLKATGGEDVYVCISCGSLDPMHRCNPFGLISNEELDKKLDKVISLIEKDVGEAEMNLAYTTINASWVYVVEEQKMYCIGPIPKNFKDVQNGTIIEETDGTYKDSNGETTYYEWYKAERLEAVNKLKELMSKESIEIPTGF